MLKFKSPFLCLLSVVCFQAGAQQMPAMDEEQMQKMMQGAMAMAECFGNLDEGRMKALAEESEAKEKEIRQLCKAGQRDEAQDVAVEYGKKYINSSEFQQLKKCADQSQGMFPAISDMSEFVEFEDKHVCDEI